MMWEYTTGAAYGMVDVMKTLNEMGAQRWEAWDMAKVESGPAEGHTLIFFKRPLIKSDEVPYGEEAAAQTAWTVSQT